MKRTCIGLLHGLYQNKTVFAAKSKALQAALPSRTTLLEYFDGPLAVTPAILKNPPRGVRPKARAQSSARDYRAWWDPDGGGDSDAEAETALLQVVQSLREAKVDGLVGFSQGGMLAALLCSHKAHELTGWIPKFVVVCNAYQSERISHQEFFRSGINPNVPSLHIAGLKDQIVKSHRSRSLSELFHNPGYVENKAGHHFPSDEGTLHEIVHFLQSIRGDS